MAKAQTAPAAKPVAADEESGADLLSGLMGTGLSKDVEAFVSTVYGGEADAASSALAAVLPYVMQNSGALSGRTREVIENLIATIDETLSNQVNEIIHHPDFQKLEGTWRGLHRLVHESQISSDLKVYVLNVSKEDLRDTFRDYPGGKWDESPVFNKIYRDRFGVLGGEPVGSLVADYQFSHKTEDVEVLKGLAKIAAASHAPLIASASPKAFKLDSWKDINKIPDPRMLFDGDEYAVWRAFRKNEDSKYVGLVLPRVLARRPYGSEGEAVKEFAFEEDVSGNDETKFTWTNASLIMAENINRSFYEHGWASEICGIGDDQSAGGVTKDLPTHTYTTDDGTQDMTCPTETAIPFAREAMLSDMGFIPLCHNTGENWAAFLDAKSAYMPQQYRDAASNANAQLSRKLPYLFAVSRFAHFLKKMVYMWVGMPYGRAEIERRLNDWISDYVLLNAENVSDYALLAEKPLSEARVEVVEDEANPGQYRARFHLRPHFRLDRIDVSLRLVSEVPTAQK